MTYEKQDLHTASMNADMTLGEYAQFVIQEQYRSVVKRERKVLADADPEPLHLMRVGTRRLRTALQVFDGAIVLPAAASAKQIGALAKTLGALRDLDVQINDLKTVYRPQVAAAEQKLLDAALKRLQKARRRAYTAVAHALTRSRYQTLKTTYENWLQQPQLTPLAQLSIATLLPDLLSPLLSELLLHPGWLVAAEAASTTAGLTLHDLRKACKHARYQAEFFAPFYGESFQTWMKDIKVLQEKLGKLQDSHVLQELLASHLPKHAQLPTLQATIAQNRSEVLSDWDDTRQKYLQPALRRQLHQMLLEPPQQPLAQHTELSKPAKTAAKTSKPTIAKAKQPNEAAEVR